MRITRNHRHDLRVMSAKESHRSPVHRPGDAASHAARFDLLHHIFEAQADARPDATAVIFGEEEITYSVLERRANRLARYLRARGVRAGSLVGMLLRRSVDAYAALLGILKAGAAYVPLDPEYPPDRVAYILKDSGAAVLLTTADLAEMHAFNGTTVRIDAERQAIDRENSARLPGGSVGALPRDLCYVIYTSGSTGRPKGVMIEHRNACNLVRAEREIFQVRPEDRVYQGASLSFDLSVEEVWLAFRAGATLVPATAEMSRAGPDLSRRLSAAGVTVLSCVPTLLSMLTEDIPTLRLLILGGETCPAGLVPRWAGAGRRLVNTYGPTETTVIATFADLVPEEPVTIGRAVPGYCVHLLDEELRPVPPGEVGEICIAGAGVARGYLGLPDETRARFVSDPTAQPYQPAARMYRSGDLGRLDAQGNIEFLGRADAQVQIRGFRVELAEIESALMKTDEVRAAACTVHEQEPGVQQLVGYVVPSDGKVDGERLRAHLRNHLPAYMVPAWIETVTDLPWLPSGKLDRTALPAPRRRITEPPLTARRPRTETQRRVAEVWQKLFHSSQVGLDDHFFLGLGGHSLLAARMVSILRKEPRYASLSMSDVYDHPTIATLAAELDRRAAQLPAVAPTKMPDPREGRRHFVAGFLQAISLYVVFGLRGSRWIAPYLVYFLLVASEYSAVESALWAAASAIAVFPTLLLIAVAAKWVVLGRVRPGRYPLWGSYYRRWWIVQNLVGALHLDDLCGTPLLPFVYRLFGAKVGKDVHLETDDLAAFDLISIRDGTSVDDTASLLGYTVGEGELIIGPVSIGRGCFIGARSVLREGTVMEDGARLEDQSLLPSGGRIPQGETWAGSPARCTTFAKPAVRPPPVRSTPGRVSIVALYAALVLSLPMLPLGMFVPGVILLTAIDLYAHPFLYLGAAPVVGASFVLLLTTSVVLLKWALVRRVQAGTYPVHGGFYVRKWIVDRLLAQSLNAVGSLHATLYLAPWYRALGARLGRFVELSTATSMTPDLLAIDEGGTIADEASLSASRVEGGWMTLTATHVGRRAFVGNGAVVPPGTVMGDGSLVGVLSVPPTQPGEAARPGVSWLGSPAIFLPRRQMSAPFPEARTYCPSRKLRLARASFEILRITLPPAGFILVTTTVVTAAIELWEGFELATVLLLLPFVYMACCAAVALAVALAKWLVMGRFRPFERPLWCPYVWRLECVNALYEFLVTPLALEALQGTPFLPWYFRILGARIGRRTYFHTTGLIEFDLVEVGDGAVVNEDAVLQSHLFEDRVLKADTLRVGRGCVVGAGSVALYDSQMEDGSRLDALSLLMKGEVLPAGTNWAGSPARPAGG